MPIFDDQSGVVVLDVTLRDGGYVNGHGWSSDDAARLVRASAEAGVRVIEVGYLRPGRYAADGLARPAGCCPPAYLERLRDQASAETALAVMAHRADVPPSWYRTIAALGVGMVRLPTGIAAWESAADDITRHIDAVHQAGMRAAVNLIRVSQVDLGALARTAAGVDRAGPDVVYLADSNGSLFPERAARAVRVVAAETAVQLGFHAHDGLRLAFSNTLAAVDAGCHYVDASLGGLGKGGGNLRLELIASYLASRYAAGFDLVPLARAAAEIIEPMRAGSAMAECDSIVSGLLDLNTDEITALRGGMAGGLVSLLAGHTPAIPTGAR